MGWTSVLSSGVQGAAGGAGGGPVGAAVGGIGGLLASILGGKSQSNAAKEAGTVLADRYQKNAEMLLGRGEEGANAISGMGHDTAFNLLDTVTQANEMEAGIANGAVGRVDDATRRGIDALTQALGGLDTYRGTGTTAAGRLNELINGDFKINPNNDAVSFRIGEAAKAVNGNAALRGMIGGNEAIALNDRAQSIASEEYDKEYQRVLQALGLGIGTGQSAMSLGLSGANDIAGLDLGGAKTTAEILTGAGARNANRSFQGSLNFADILNQATGDAARLRYGSTRDATGELSGSAEATAASKIGNANAFGAMLGNLQRTAGPAIDWLGTLGKKRTMPAPAPVNV